MYQPVRPRPRKTDITRTRTGCQGCRKRRTKCDEKKPSCSTCVRLQRPCEPCPPKLEFRNVPSPMSGTQRHCTDTGNPSSPGKSAISSTAQRSNQVMLENSTIIAFDPSSHAISTGICGGPWTPSQESLVEATEEIPDQFDALHLQVDTRRQSLGDEALFSLDIPPTILPHREPVYLSTFYMDIWSKYCLPALHSSFTQFDTVQRSSQIIPDMIVALSACRLSRILPQRKNFTVSAIPGLCYKPDDGHESLSHEHYGASMRSMAWMNPEDFNANPTLSLAVLVLFCYLESSMGNFQGFRLHSEGTKRLMQNYPDWVSRNGAGLLAAWVEIEMQNWWRRVYFSTPDFQRHHKTLMLTPQLEAILNTGNHQRAAVLLILCESHRLNTSAVIVSYRRGCDDSEESLVTSAGTEEVEAKIALEEHAYLLGVQSEKLDSWYARLAVSDLPQFWQGEKATTAPNQTKLDVQPLRFSSHISAMNFAYYVTARILQCTSPIDDRENMDIDDAYEEAESWVQVLLQIAAGINWEQCIRLNVYTIGLSGLLLTAAIQSRSLATGLWIQNWLEERMRGDEFEEANFPIFQVLEVIRLLQRERQAGRDVASLFQTTDDGGGSGKLGSYHSQRLASLWVYARGGDARRMYSYHVSL